MEDKLEILLSPAELSGIVTRLAGELRLAYGTRPLVIISILNGAFVFTADLIRALNLSVELDFMRLASYGRRDTPAEKVSILKDIDIDIKDREVLIVEDIVDRGLTLLAARERLLQKGPAGLKVCTLLLRKSKQDPSSGNEGVASADFVGRRIGAGFVVGYGMDYKERYRELSGLHTLTAISTGEKGGGHGS